MKQITIETDTERRMSINVLEDNKGYGYRLAGRKYDGTGAPVVVARIAESDAKKIRQVLDEAFPVAVDLDSPVFRDVQAWLAEEVGEHAAHAFADRFAATGEADNRG